MATLSVSPPAVMQSITDVGFVCLNQTVRFMSPNRAVAGFASRVQFWMLEQLTESLYEHLSDRMSSICPKPRYQRQDKFHGIPLLLQNSEISRVDQKALGFWMVVAVLCGGWLEPIVT